MLEALIDGSRSYVDCPVQGVECISMSMSLRERSHCSIGSFWFMTAYWSASIPAILSNNEVAMENRR